MISSEYGWADETILDLYVCRLRQIVSAVELRIKQRELKRDLVTEWQTKTLASFIAGTVKVPKGKNNPLAKAVDKIRLVDDRDMPEEPEVDREGPRDNRASNPVGTFEQLSRGFKPRPQDT